MHGCLAPIYIDPNLLRRQDRVQPEHLVDDRLHRLRPAHVLGVAGLQHARELLPRDQVALQIDVFRLARHPHFLLVLVQQAQPVGQAERERATVLQGGKTLYELVESGSTSLLLKNLERNTIQIIQLFIIETALSGDCFFLG